MEINNPYKTSDLIFMLLLGLLIGVGIGSLFCKEIKYIVIKGNQIAAVEEGVLICHGKD